MREGPNRAKVGRNIVTKVLKAPSLRVQRYSGFNMTTRSPHHERFLATFFRIVVECSNEELLFDDNSSSHQRKKLFML